MVLTCWRNLFEFRRIQSDFPLVLFKLWEGSKGFLTKTTSLARHFHKGGSATRENVYGDINNPQSVIRPL